MINLFEKPVVVFGAGSIGERHIRNLWKLGFRNIYVFRQRNLPFKNIDDAKVIIIKQWEEVSALTPFAAIITSPTSYHIEQTIKCVELGMHVLVEKPLSHDLERIDELYHAVQNNRLPSFVYIGYMQRFHPLVIEAKKIIESRQYGTLISLQSKWAEYLPDWHPWEDYRESYAARKDLGGGAALTLSHDVDTAAFLMQSATANYFIQKNYRSKLQVDVDSGADFLIKYTNGCTANIHVNYYEKCKERFLKLVFDDASIHVDFFAVNLTIMTPAGKSVTRLDSFDRNDLFIEQSKFFFEKTQNGFTVDDSLNNIKNSVEIIKICNGK